MLVNMGMLSYSNALPLAFKLAQDPQLSLHYDTPNNLYRALKKGAIECALTSSIHMLDDELIPFTDFGIAAKNEVLSVNLYHKGPVQELSGKTIAISNETSSSFALLRILCRELWQITPNFQVLTREERFTDFEAALLIGDIALLEHKGYYCLDLGEAWYKLTGLPFVFARFFLSESSDIEDALSYKIEESLHYGLSHLSALCSMQKKLPFALVHNYYKKLTYHLGPKEKEGLQTFIALCKKLPTQSNNQKACSNSLTESHKIMM